ncbi:MAG: fructose-1,6-bisphosphatase [Eubacterium sp.]|nr:fructose-1,6-bisphosphatase [Eubacterium sp.]
MPMNKKSDKYLELLSEKYPAKEAVIREIINLSAILNLPKGTEHFMSDIHGEYEAFCHILNNCSGVIREKVMRYFGEEFSKEQCQELCTLIYYPREKMDMLKSTGELTEEWYRENLNRLIELAKRMSSKYTRSKVRKAMPGDFSYIIDELLHVQKDEDDNQVLYHQKILDTIIEVESADGFIMSLAELIKRLAVDHLHIVGDIFDRGPYPHKIMELLINHHSLDIEWGNHDILWMGAACGNGACIANAIRNNLRHNNTEVLESGYGISMRSLTLFAENMYDKQDPMEAAAKAISVIMLKLEGQLIKAHPEYGMNDRLLLDKMDVKTGHVIWEGIKYSLNDNDFPTVDPKDPYTLTEEEKAVMKELRAAFLNSAQLQKHVKFLYEKGSMYRVFNGNLLYHGCIPFDAHGKFDRMEFDGKVYQGKAYLDYADAMAREAFLKKTPEAVDFMWFLWSGRKSPLCGRNIRTFERMFLDDERTWREESNPYYKFYHQEEVCNMILGEFGLHSETSHIVNGHTPVKTMEGEQPIRANGKLMVIDGGFCKDYHEKTGIAGYTLIYNSHGVRIKAHHPFESVYKALRENKDIDSESMIVDTEENRILVKDTDNGRRIQEQIDDLKQLKKWYER